MAGARRRIWPEWTWILRRFAAAFYAMKAVDRTRQKPVHDAGASAFSVDHPAYPD
jgi:hypothetical protein